jgi:hypothetical protein
MAITVEQLFQQTTAGKLPALIRLKGEDAYLEREWKTLLVQAGFEVEDSDWGGKPPDREVEALGLGTSLFAPRRVLWCRRPAPASKWDDEDESLWGRVRASADGEGLIAVVQVPADKRLKWDVLGRGFEEVDLDVPPARRGSWIKRMNEVRGKPLDAAAAAFLAMQDGDLLQLDVWVELWSLGGEAWAKQALGYGVGGGQAGGGGDAPENPAFAWVDAVLAGDRARGSRLLEILRREKSEPLQLLALLVKSVRIYASLEEGGSGGAGQPDFLVRKLRGTASQWSRRDPARGRRLLKRCAELDRQLKSTPLNGWAALSALA